MVAIMRRRAVLLLVLVAGAAAAAWSGFWFYAARDIQKRIGAWAEAQRAAGLTADYAGIVVDGFPMRWRATIDSPAMAGAGPTAWAWRGERVIATITPWALHDIPASFPGLHRLTAGVGDLAEEIELRAERPAGRVILSPQGRLDRLDLDLGAAVLRRRPDPAPIRAAQLAASLEPHRVPGATHRTDVFDLVARARDVTLPAGSHSALGESIALAELALSVRGGLPPGRLAESLAAWRDGGGVLDIHRLALRWGPLAAEGDGTLTLDGENRPLGAFSARIRGYAETLDALALAKLVRPRDAAAVKIALNLFARQDADGRRELNVPITAQDGRLTVAGFPLARVPALTLE